jgi:hypothetical protein
LQLQQFNFYVLSLFVNQLLHLKKNEEQCHEEKKNNNKLELK